MNKNNEKTIYLSQFQPKVADGPVKYKVLNATYDKLSTKKNGVVEIVKLELELQELNNPDGDKEVKSVNLFINFNPMGYFYKFVQSAVTALSTTSFQPSRLIGLNGEAILSHYQPKGSDFSFPQLNDWVFYEKNEKVAKVLAKYQVEDMEIDGAEDKEGEKNV